MFASTMFEAISNSDLVLLCVSIAPQHVTIASDHET